MRYGGKEERFGISPRGACRLFPPNHPQFEIMNRFGQKEPTQSIWVWELVFYLVTEGYVIFRNHPGHSFLVQGVNIQGGSLEGLLRGT